MLEKLLKTTKISIKLSKVYNFYVDWTRHSSIVPRTDILIEKQNKNEFNKGAWKRIIIWLNRSVFLVNYVWYLKIKYWKDSIKIYIFSLSPLYWMKKCAFSKKTKKHQNDSFIIWLIRILCAFTNDPLESRLLYPLVKLPSI